MFEKRIKLVRELTREDKIDGLLVSNVVNIFYLTGFTSFDPAEREGFLLITKNENYIFTDGRYSEAVIRNIKGFTLLETTTEKPFIENLKEIVSKLKLKKVGFEEHNLSVAEYEAISKTVRLSPSGLLVEKLRQTKEDLEIEKIKHACKLTDDAFEFILTRLKPGATELQIVKELEDMFWKSGATPSFDPIVAFGPNSSLPHHKSGNTKLNKNQAVLMDFGVKLDGYCSDFTRTIFFGKAENKFKDMYYAVKNSQQAAFDYLAKTKNPTLEEADKAARDHIVSKGFPSIPHSLGHGIGIEVHEFPRLSPKSKEKAKNNIVFSIEPGIYLPGIGGVRIEDLVLFKFGPKLLTHSNRDLIEI